MLVVAGQIGVVSYYENFTLLLVPLAAAFYLAIDRGHSVRAAVALGISITIKPLLLPLFVVFVLHRLWRSLTIAVLIPFVLTCIAFVIVAFSGSPSQFFHEVSVVFGSDARFPINMSISGMGSILSLPVWLVVTFRVTAGLLCVGMCRRMWLHPIGGPGEQAIWLTAPLLVGMILCFTFAWACYAVLFLPLVLVTLDRRDWGGRLVQIGVVLALLFPLLAGLTSGYPSAHPSRHHRLPRSCAGHGGNLRWSTSRTATIPWRDAPRWISPDPIEWAISTSDSEVRRISSAHDGPVDRGIDDRSIQRARLSRPGSIDLSGSGRADR